jgi:threonine dehydrogenase-like Zn-dependent dehydrogenase
MHAYLGHDERRPAPLILGHEAAGVVVDGPGEGRRVTVNPLATCGNAACRSGRDNLCPDRQIISMQPREGGFADYLRCRSAIWLPCRTRSAFDKAALPNRIACGWHGVRLAKRALSHPVMPGACHRRRRYRPWRGSQR